MTRDTFYCPSGDMQNADALWDWKGGYCVSGYFWLTARFKNGGPVLIAPAQYQSRADAPHSSEAVVATDATLSENDDFAGVVGGWDLPHRSSHLSRRRPDKADGGNILFLDGHAEWRSFSEMQIRCRPAHDEWY